MTANETPSARDPRCDPRPGDVVRSRFGDRFEIFERVGRKVSYMTYGSPESVDIDEWVDLVVNDEVLHASE